MAELIVPDRVTKLATDHLNGRISDREFRQSLRDFSTAELNELVEFTQERLVRQPGDE
jgi:hypothetical protein